MKLKHFIEKELGKSVTIFNDKRVEGRRLKFLFVNKFDKDLERELLKVAGVVKVGFAPGRGGYGCHWGATIFTDRDLRDINIEEVPEKTTITEGEFYKAMYSDQLDIRKAAKDKINLLEKQLITCQNTLKELKEIVG